MSEHLKALSMLKRPVKAHMHPHMQRFSPFLPALVALLVALLSGVVLFNTAIFSSLISAVISVGLDPLRAQLLAALLVRPGPTGG